MLPSAENFWRLSTSLTVKPKSLQSFALFAFTSLIYQFSIAHTCSSPTGFHAPLLDRVLCICCSSTRILFQMFVWFTHSAPPNLCANITFLVRVFWSALNYNTLYSLTHIALFFFIAHTTICMFYLLSLSSSFYPWFPLECKLHLFCQCLQQCLAHSIFYIMNKLETTEEIWGLSIMYLFIYLTSMNISPSSSILPQPRLNVKTIIKRTFPNNLYPAGLLGSSVQSFIH